MTAREFENWTAETATSKCHWQSDPVAVSRGDFLFYCGGTNGRFISVLGDGTVEMGTYEGAIPHIGEAMFKVEFRKKFDTRVAAVSRVLLCGGPEFRDHIGTEVLYIAQRADQASVLMRTA